MQFLLEPNLTENPCTRAVVVMSQCIHRMHSDELKSLFEKTRHVKRLIQLIKWSAPRKNELMVSASIEIIIKVIEKSSKACTSMIDAGIIIFISSCVENFASNEINDKCLELLTNLSSMLDCNSLQEVYTSSNVENIRLLTARLNGGKADHESISPSSSPSE
ncbi:Armadillo repeat-containing protein 5 [Caenorhabditis elegans]|uniref:Armadillo repeat-containing protein 5 n=1 Tax=Caenorhabditis elegans TaxID=6239 RepID=A0A060Q600_CAEEL|nr:Armadillo repeat-containing protein 5 [Caenorhabditis elegans]CCE71451.2 Armadillo repeat-containing protein 5 [Caenorhabditis elegans]|eukprot:NP_001294217.1 Uncharacterized protein CELE_F58D2.3 [Caenorhabditis elegans]